MKLELNSWKKSLLALERALNIVQAQPDASNIDLIETLRAGVVQNFEVAYEQSWKMIKRWLEQNLGSSYVDGVTRRQLFRLSHENRLIDDVDLWMTFHHSRNQTSHTYNQTTADEVFTVATQFLPQATDLFSRIEKRND